jgi:diketogulonate reductase-like aldo/keto reductase
MDLRALGLGTYTLTDPETCSAAVATALDPELTAEDVTAIDGIDRRHRAVDASDAPWNQP